MASRTAEVDETTLSEEDDVTSILHGVTIDLRLDVDDLGGVLLQPCNVDFNVKVSNAAQFQEKSRVRR